MVVSKNIFHEKKLRVLAIIVSCYGAFAVGTNNVANAVGPLSAAGVLGVRPGLFLIAPLFGLGAFFFGRRNIETFGKEVVPLGLITSNIVCLVTGSLLILASSFAYILPCVLYPKHIVYPYEPNSFSFLLIQITFCHHFLHHH